MNNPPILFPTKRIEKEIKPNVYEDIKDKSIEEVRDVLNFYVKICLNDKISNSSYNYSHCRAVITVICYFKDWELPQEVVDNDTDRNENQDKYYFETKHKVVSKRKEPKVKDEAACRTKVSLHTRTAPVEPTWIVKDIRRPNLPSVEQIMKFHEARNNRT